MAIEETANTDWHNRRVIRRTWRNAHHRLHRTTGPAWEEWTVRPGGAYALSHQSWYLNGKLHRKGRPAHRYWHVAVDGTRLLWCEEWCERDEYHRVSGPSRRRWIHHFNDGTRELYVEEWYMNGKPACWLHGPNTEMKSWFRRGRKLLVTLASAAPLRAGQRGRAGDRGASPAWSVDVRVQRMSVSDSAFTSLISLYCSVIGGAVLLCV